jgi:acyl carrier protein
MLSEDLKEQIKDMLITNLMLRVPKEEIENDLTLFGADGLGLDSIDALQLVVSMEMTFGVGIPNSEVARVALASVNSIHDYILQQTGRKPA